jgi:DNA topoisomerase-1
VAGRAVGWGRRKPRLAAAGTTAAGAGTGAGAGAVDTKYLFLPIKKDLTINIDKIKGGEYVLEDLVEYTTPSLGQYENQEIFIRTGKYGNYVEWGENKQSIKEIRKNIGDITLADVVHFMEKKKNIATGGENSNETPSNGVLRVLNDKMSIRTGKFGPYVFYKTAEMKKPIFLNIKKFKEGFFVCETVTLVEWLCRTYNLPEP